MSPIPLGILAVAGSAPAGAYELISTQVLSGEANSVTFSSIPQTYRHLQVRAEFSQNGGDVVFMRFNGVSTASYAWHWLNGGRFSVAESEAATSESSIRLGVSPANARTAMVCDVLDYASISKNTTARTLYGQLNGPRIILGSGGFFNTAAVTSLSIHATVGAAFQATTRLSLYGIKG
jgi:hypothetical protein